MRRRDVLLAAGLAVTSPGLWRRNARATDPDISPEPRIKKTLTGPMLCVAPHVEAAEAGASILAAGGNAFDAAVAAGFMEAVVSPQNSGIGGYGATGVVFHAKSGRVFAIDANAVAPRAATPTMFPTVAGKEPYPYRLPDSKHKRGPLSVAVPGVLGGLLTMLDKWGRLDRKQVMAPAIRQAQAGIKLAATNSRSWLKMQAEAEGGTLPGNEVPDPLPMPELAETLQALAEEGQDLFYSGRIGQAIADHIQKLGGILTRDDQAAYRVLIVEPLTVAMRGHSLCTPPPGAGGVTSLQAIALFDLVHGVTPLPIRGGADFFDALLEIDKVVWTERLTAVGDPSAMTDSPQSLLSVEHLTGMLEKVLQGRAKPTPGKIIAPDPLNGTVHLAAADQEGNVVAWTQTHGGGFGSGVMVPKTGIVLGHGMCRFEPRPGWVNSVAAGKRPLHNMSPIIAVKDGRVVLAVGAAGGRTIVNNSATLTINHLIMGQSAVESITAPRLQCESAEPAVLEATAGPECLAALRAKGHSIKETKRDAGTAHLIVSNGTQWTAAAEPRNPTASVNGPA